MPLGLCRFIDRLTATDLDRRFPRAHAALAELTAFEPRLQNTVVDTDGGTLLVAPLVGRHSELQHARKLIRKARDKRSLSVIIVSAPAGHGKSRLLSALLGLCRRDEIRVDLDTRMAAEEKLRPEGDTLEAIEDKSRAVATQLSTRPVWIIDDADKLSDVSRSQRTKTDELAITTVDDGSRLEKGRYEPIAFRVFADVVVMFGHGELHGRGKDGPYQHSYDSFNVFAKRDGKWCYAAAFTP